MQKFVLIVFVNVALFLLFSSPFTTAFPLIRRDSAVIGKRCETCFSARVACAWFGACGTSSWFPFGGFGFPYGPGAFPFGVRGFRRGAWRGPLGVPGEGGVPPEGLGGRIGGKTPSRMPIGGGVGAGAAGKPPSQGSSMQKRCLIGSFACFGQTLKPVYHVDRVSTFVPVVGSKPEKIIVNNNNEVNIVPPKVVVPEVTHERVEKEIIAMTVTEKAPVTVFSRIIESIMAIQTPPAETIMMDNWVTRTELATVPVIESVLTTERPPAETFITNNFLTVTQVATASVTESFLATQTPLPETVVRDNYLTLTQVETTAVTESLIATQTPPAETVMMNNYVTVTQVATAPVTERVIATQTPPVETVTMNNFLTVTQTETASIVQFARPSPVPYIAVAAPCQELACVQAPACVGEGVVCT